MLFQERKLSAAVGSEETEVTDLHETFGQHMLKEALEETFNRESAVFELPGIRSAILKGNLGCLHAALVNDLDQAAIADGDAVDIRGEILESGLSISHRFAMDNPIPPPHFVRDL
jgi:hypothetical protein